MSHYTVCKTKITDAKLLAKALKEMGVKEVEVHEQAEHLYGYQGDKRPQTAEVIIRRKYVGASSNDIGFKRQEDGTFQAIISEYDSSRYNQKWLNDLNQNYSYAAVVDTLESQGIPIDQVTRKNGEITVQCTLY